MSVLRQLFGVSEFQVCIVGILLLLLFFLLFFLGGGGGWLFCCFCFPNDGMHP